MTRVPAWARTAALCAVAIPILGCVILRPDDGRVGIMFFNVQNLFDGYADGSEYPDFLPRNGWTPEDARQRMSSVGRAIAAVEPRPDVLVLLEIENGATLDRLVDVHLVDGAYRWRTFVRAPGGATGIGVASRYPIVAARSMLPRAGLVTPVRPILEVELAIDGDRLILFANHWKSRLGGEAATEPLRIAAARMIEQRLVEIASSRPGVAVVVGGDFNAEPAAVSSETGFPPRALGAVGGAATSAGPAAALLVARSGADAREASHLSGRPVLVDLWSESDAPGSYAYRGEWQRIDAVYVGAELVDGVGLEVRSFDVRALDGQLDERGFPRSADRSPSAISDHLPLFVTIGAEGGREMSAAVD